MDKYDDFAALFEKQEAEEEEQDDGKKKVKKHMKTAKKYICQIVTSPDLARKPTYFDLRKLYKEFGKGCITPNFEEVINELRVDGLVATSSEGFIIPQVGILKFLES